MSTVVEQEMEAEATELEMRANVPSREALLARKRTLMKELAPLAAMHRSNGQGTPADAGRKRHRAIVSKKILEALKEAGQKEPSEAALERMANADGEHIAFCEDLEADAVRYQVLMVEKEEIDYRLRARETELNVYAAELRLAR
jgi:hypothetical protein